VVLVLGICNGKQRPTKSTKIHFLLLSHILSLPDRRAYCRGNAFISRATNEEKPVGAGALSVLTLIEVVANSNLAIEVLLESEKAIVLTICCCFGRAFAGVAAFISLQQLQCPSNSGKTRQGRKDDWQGQKEEMTLDGNGKKITVARLSSISI
jgi:predicted amino acid racemase